jgi:hypothetical protein
MPILTEGKNLYVFGREKVKEASNEAKDGAGETSTTTL